MIHTVVNHIADVLNGHLRLRTGTDVLDPVVPGLLVGQGGEDAPGVEDRVVLAVVNVEEDRTTQPPDAYERVADDRFDKMTPAMRLNLFLAFIANQTQYDEGLKSLSYIAAYFQRKRYIDFAEITDLQAEAGRLVFELQSLTFEQLNHLWGALGSKYQPSLVYRVRAVPIREPQVEAVVAPVTEIDIREAQP